MSGWVFHSPGDSGADRFFHSPGDSGADGFLDVFADPPGVLLLIAGHRDQAGTAPHCKLVLCQQWKTNFLEKQDSNGKIPPEL